jgi:hypothetical protein
MIRHLRDAQCYIDRLFPQNLPTLTTRKEKEITISSYYYCIVEKYADEQSQTQLSSAPSTQTR